MSSPAAVIYFYVCRLTSCVFLPDEGVPFNTMTEHRYPKWLNERSHTNPVCWKFDLHATYLFSQLHGQTPAGL